VLKPDIDIALFAARDPHTVWVPRSRPDTKLRGDELFQ